MAEQYVVRRQGAASNYTGSHSGVGVDPTDNRFYVNTDGTGRRAVQLGLGDAEVLSAASTLTAEDSGKVFFLNSATEFATTLPAPVLGFRAKFIVSAAPDGASYTIVTAGGANIIKGGVNELETNDTVDGPSDTDGDTITFVDGVAVAGDYVELISDGTSYFVTGQTVADGGVTITS